jgi:hypothetical protein
MKPKSATPKTKALFENSRRRARPPAACKGQLREIRERALATGSNSFLKCSRPLVSSATMDDKLTPADPSDLANAIAFAFRFNK